MEAPGRFLYPGITLCSGGVIPSHFHFLSKYDVDSCNHSRRTKSTKEEKHEEDKETKFDKEEEEKCQKLRSKLLSEYEDCFREKQLKEVVINGMYIVIEQKGPQK